MFARNAEQRKGLSASNRSKPDPDAGSFWYTGSEEALLAWKLASKTLARTNASSVRVTPRVSFYTKHGKRAFDIAASVLALALTLPLNILLMACTFLDVGAPVFSAQKSIGRDGQPFVPLRFRTMKNAYDGDGALLPPSERVTRFGRFAGWLSLDELPCFWSILKGDMSVIGPRPMEFDYFQRFSRRHNQRHLVKPGLACPFLAPPPQPDDWNAQFENDVWYVENIGLTTDIKLFFALVASVFDARRSKPRGLANQDRFIGYDMSGKAIGTRDLDHIELD